MKTHKDATAIGNTATGLLWDCTMDDISHMERASCAADRTLQIPQL